MDRPTGNPRVQIMGRHISAAASAALVALLLAVTMVATRPLAAVECEHWLGFTTEVVDSSIPFDRVVGGRSTVGEIEVLVGEGPPGRTHIFPAIISDTTEDRVVQGWALSIQLDGEAVCVDATVEGTAGLRPGGFEVAECVNRGLSGGRDGVVAATVITTFGPNHFLPPVGTFSVLDITIDADGPQGEDDKLAGLRFVDDLVGGGQPVQNNFQVQGQTVRPCNRDDAAITVRFRPDGIRRFIRGDANADLALDVSDAVTLLRFFFHGDARVRCDDAGDANDDGKLDIADAVFIFGYLFLGSRPPPAPFPEEGLDPTPDALRCRPDAVPTGE